MPAIHGPFLRPYGQLTNMSFALYKRGGGDDIDGGIIPELGDSKIVKDEANTVNTSTGFVVTDGAYTIELTALEMSAARIILFIIDVSTPKLWVDTVVFIETYGHVLSEHPSIGNSAIPQGGI